jgi:glucokinase
MLVAGDIGGTKSDLAIFSGEAGVHAPLAQERLHSADYSSLQSMVKQFLARANQPVDCACFAVAGPVINGRVKTTNLPWEIDEPSVAQSLNLNVKSVRLINDLEAIGRAVPILRPSDVCTISPGEPVTGGAIAVIAPGTGLGESFLTWDGMRYTTFPSEGGHSDFAPTDQRQVRLLEYLLKQFDHVSYEHVCSGIGIPHIYRFLRDVERIPEDEEMIHIIDSAPDPSVPIINRALDAEHPGSRCAAAIDCFASILAAESGNLALKCLATGGIYIAGGVAVHTLPVIMQPTFAQRFKSKGRFAPFMARIPIHVVVTPAGLAGAAFCGLEGAARSAAFN